MKTVANVIVALVRPGSHYIVYLEMFLWTTPKGKGLRHHGRFLRSSRKRLLPIRACTTASFAAGLIGDCSRVTQRATRSSCSSSSVLVAGFYGAADGDQKDPLYPGTAGLLGIAALLLA